MARRRVRDPIEGQAQVVFCPAPDRDETGDTAMFSRLSMFLVLHAPGVPARPVRVTKSVRSSTFPRPGDVIPAVLDRQDPEQFEIRWDERPTGDVTATLAGGDPLDLTAQALATLTGEPVAPEPPPATPPPQDSPPDTLTRLTALRDRGALTDDELEAERRRFGT